ncbi:glycosyltransferase [Weeksella virosa]|uniref:glycosyltransferase n=1 Tax=Weeksella virosa TaxID=1014 RepID=UPI000F82A7FC
MITIFTPTYNRRIYYLDFFEVFFKKIKNFKWLVVNDGSTDNTKKIFVNLLINN